MLQSVIDRLTIARALARCRARNDDEEIVVERWLPVFTSAGSRVGDPWVLGLDWSRLSEECLSSPGVAEILHRTLEALSARYRATALVDTEGVAAADVAAGIGEPLEAVQRRLHWLRMALRERLTHYFARQAPATDSPTAILNLSRRTVWPELLGSELTGP